MSLGGAKNVPTDVQPAGIADDSQATNQETIPVPVLGGEAKIAVIWLSLIYNQRAVPAPQGRPGKK